MAQRNSEKSDWDAFWTSKESLDEVYEHSDVLVSEILRQGPVAGLRALEVGAGTGRDSFRLSALGADVTVLDYSRPSFKIIAEQNVRAPKTLAMTLGDGLGLPFRDNSFDLVYHYGLLEHFRDPYPLLRENIRVLKPGGKLVFGVPQRWHIFTVMKHILMAMNRWFAGWETEFSMPELKRVVTKSGVEVVDQFGEWFRPSLAYRIVRVSANKLGVKLPLYPKALLPGLRGGVRQWFERTRLAPYTQVAIGVVAVKPAPHSANGHGSGSNGAR